MGEVSHFLLKLKQHFRVKALAKVIENKSCQLLKVASFLHVHQERSKTGNNEMDTISQSIGLRFGDCFSTPLAKNRRVSPGFPVWLASSAEVKLQIESYYTCLMALKVAGVDGDRTADG